MSNVILGAMGYHTLPAAVVPNGCRAPTSPLQGFKVSRVSQITVVSCVEATAVGLIAAVGLCLPWGTLAITPLLWCRGIAPSFYQSQAFIKGRRFMYCCRGMKRPTEKGWITLRAFSSYLGSDHFKALHTVCWALSSKYLLPSFMRSRSLSPTTDLIHHCTKTPFLPPW